MMPGWLERTSGSAWGCALVRALLVFVALADGLLSLEVWSLHSEQARAAALAVLAVVAPVRPLAAFALSAGALYVATRPKRAFHRVLLLLAGTAGAISVQTHSPALVAVALADGLAAMLAASFWPEEGDPFSSRLGWSLMGVAAALAMIAGWLLLGPVHRGHHPAPLFLLPLVVACAAAVAGATLLDRNPPVPARRDPEAALRLYDAAGRSGVSPFALMRDKRTFWSGDGGAFVAFGCRTGAALALGPAVGPAGAAARAHREFRAVCRSRGWRPAFYQVAEETAAQLAGCRRLMIGSEAMVEVDRFGLHGRRMANVRHQVARAGRLGVTAEVLPDARLPREVRSAMRQMADAAAARARLGQMAFSVGRPDDPVGVERTAGLAFHGERQLVAYVTWLWLPAAATMVLDEVRRSPGAPAGSVELLIATCLESFRGRAARASLGLAPITGGGSAAGLAAAEGFLSRALGLPSVSPGLYAFKAKFNPTWEPRYLVVERLTDLPPVLLTTLLLHFPDLTPRRLARAGVEAPRLP
ncbi:MAG TPA: DUF2156 domain-containing protein [Candidatus Dormibacteraeota bacterium]|nr:DUF2156 domain-containing protein [Candidatus Dormibacteraeota bacterium]